MAPAGIIGLTCFGGFAAWTLLISCTDSGLLPHYVFVGLHQYHRLFSSGRWWTTLHNFGVFGALLLIGCTALGYLLAALINRRGETVSVYGILFVLPMSISFVVTGIVWQWLLNPSTGIQAMAHQLGWAGLHVDWLVRADRAIYTVAIAGVWQQTGMSMMLFLAGMRAIDANVWKAARVDGVSGWRLYMVVIAPMLCHVFGLNTILLVATLAKSFDLVVTLTAGGPGFASDLPARFVVEHIFERQELALGAAGACIILFLVIAALTPYRYLSLRSGSRQ